MAHINWFYRKLLDKMGSGPINPAESDMVKETLKVVKRAIVIGCGRRGAYPCVCVVRWAW